MAITVLLMQCVLLCVVVVGATEVVSEFPRSMFGDSFTNMAFCDGIVYIGAKNYIYILNATDLGEIHKVSTCTGKCSTSNINKVLMVNKKLKQMIICGTGNGGSCNIRSLNTTFDVLHTSMTNDKDLDTYLVVSTNEARPSAFVLTENTDGLYTGVTFGPGVITSRSTQRGITYHSYISYYSLVWNTLSMKKNLLVELGNGVGVPLESYLIYFKAGFSLDGFVYFVTNQKFKIGDSNYTSKLIRLCQNDRDFNSYTDIKLECENNGTVYNLIQDVSVFEPGEDLRKHFNATGKIMAATFASGSNPESPAFPSAICLYKLEDINRNIMQAKRNFITCSVHRFPEAERYLSINGDVCLNSSQYEADKFTCSRTFQQFTYITGNESSSLSAHATFTTSSSDSSGYFSKIQTSTSGNNTILHTGTSNGWLIKLNANTAQADVFDQKGVDEGHPITGLHVEPGGRIEYVMSERKILKYEITACKYATCAATMQTRNPLCGWCVYENKSTFKENMTCPYQSYHGHWLSSLTECLTLDVHPKGVPVGTTVNVQVIVGINIPQNLPGDMYECKFTNGSDSSDTVATLISDGNSFRCDSGSTAAHSEGKLEFFVIHSDTKIFLAETNFLFYDCGHYKKCGDCTGDTRASCSWDSLNTRCIANILSYSFIQEKTNCPKFQKDTDTHYIPSGIAKKLIFDVSNLVNSSDTRYYCRLNESVVEAVKENDNNISCTLMVSADSNKESEYVIHIIYGLTRNSTFDGENKVVVYNCEKMGTDCSICRSIKYTNVAYKCVWYSGSCIYPTVTASYDEKCSPPYITRVVPNTAATNGNITVTVYGQELGSKFEEVNNISLAGVACVPLEQNYQASKCITCEAGTAKSAQTGPILVFVNTQRSTENVSFSYKLPKVTKVIPERGPRAGGTIITIKGTDLGIGTRVVSVYVSNNNTTYERKECTKAEVKPDIALEAITSSVFWIECDTPGAFVGEFLETLEIVFEGGTSIKTDITFIYLENPEIDGMRPYKGIVSGGNRLTVIGKKLKNAYRRFVTGMDETTFCEVESEIEMFCPVPKLSSHQEKDTSDGINMEIIISLDGVKRTFVIQYFRDPSFSTFAERNKVKLFTPDQPQLIINGKHLNLVAGKSDFIVTVGVDKCEVLYLHENNLTCVAPTSQPDSGIPGRELPEVNVSFGNVHATVGYLDYRGVAESESTTMTVIVVTVVCALVVVIAIVIVLLVIYKRAVNKVLKYQTSEVQMTNDIIEEMFKNTVPVNIIEDIAGRGRTHTAGNHSNNGQSSTHREHVDEHGFQTFATSPSIVPVFNDDMKLILQDQNLLIDSDFLQLGELLGKGHFGSVYKGTLTDPNDIGTSLVAVKTLHQNNPRAIDIQAFIDEAFIMKDFNHPRVLKLLGICLGLDDMPLVVLPFLQRGDLLSFLRDEHNSPSVRDLINFGIDISEGMTYLSELKFVHRDLAARNCIVHGTSTGILRRRPTEELFLINNEPFTMLDDDLHVTVADFGLSRDIYEKEYYSCENKKTVLPVKWMALECLEKGKYSSKSDVWSFGIVFWELFTRGNHPYPDVDNWDILRYLKEGRRLSQPQFCPDQLYKLMRQCWSSNPKDRPEFSEIECTVKKIITELELEMKQGQETANIQTTYVNLDICTECLYTNEFIAPPDDRDLPFDENLVLLEVQGQSSVNNYLKLNKAEQENSAYDQLQTSLQYI